nr:MAG TPA: hypothetical protein [Caudoviricetes sp.]
MLKGIVSETIFVIIDNIYQLLIVTFLVLIKRRISIC